MKALKGFVLDRTRRVRGKAMKKCIAMLVKTVTTNSPRDLSKWVMLQAFNMVVAIHDAIPMGVIRMTKNICYNHHQPPTDVRHFSWS